MDQTGSSSATVDTRYDRTVKDVGDSQSVRVRDPQRATKILDAAAELFALRSFRNVSMAEVGQAAGIVGSGIYRHFDSKYAVLVALLEGAMAPLLKSADTIVSNEIDSSVTMRELVRTQIDFCVERRLHVQLYRQELHSLQPEDSRRLRRTQRRYNEHWVATLLELRPKLDEAAARALVHATIGAIQSIVSYDGGQNRDEQTTSLLAISKSCLSTEW